MKSLRDNLAIFGFILMTLAVAICCWLLDHKNRRIQELMYEIQKDELEDKLKTAHDAVRENGELNAQALKRYHDLLTRYKPLADKLGVRTPRTDSRGTEAND
jgi:uncharacterized protein YaaR (DUF327 family)